jgi:cell division initiation protein
MRLTPLDIQKHSFPSRLRGYDPAEVDGFLELLAQDYEALVHEVEFLRETVRTLERRVGELSANEEMLRQTLVKAQEISEDLKRTALKESEIMIGEAEVKAEKVLDAAHRRAAKLAEDIREMKGLRSRLAGAVRAQIDTHLALLEGLASSPEDPLEEKIAYLTPPRRASGSGEGA